MMTSQHEEAPAAQRRWILIMMLLLTGNIILSRLPKQMIALRANMRSILCRVCDDAASVTMPPETQQSMEGLKVSMPAAR